MLYREIIAVCCEIHTKHINTLCGQNVGFVSVKPGGTRNKHLALELVTFVYQGLSIRTFLVRKVATAILTRCVMSPASTAKRKDARKLRPLV
jgi:hypothetical protein